MAAGLDPRTPVLVGAAAITERVTDPARADDAVALMVRALRDAATDAGGPDPHRLISQAGLILAPQGSWKCIDPGRMVADRLGITPHTVYVELGVLQQTLFTRAAEAIANGDASVVLVCGGEAKARSSAAARAGIEVAPEPKAALPADTVLAPASEVVSRLEIERKLYVAARQYAIIETALRASAGLSIDEHAREVAALWDGFANVARQRPEAWNRDAPLLDDGRATDKNPWYAWPYTKQHCSYWTVDQAAGFILCSVEAAEAAGIPTDRWVFPLAASESNAMVVLSERPEPARAPMIAANALAIAEIAGMTPADADYFDIYSCFPAAVRMQAIELGLPPDRPWTITGGMSFGGGPLNNYTLQSTARMMQVLREDPGATGLITAISGMITKQATALWSTTPPEAGFASADVTDEALMQTGRVPADGDYSGSAEVLGYTVTYENAAPKLGIILARGDGCHTIATTDDADTLTDMTTSEWVGRTVKVNGPAFTGE